MKRLLPFLFIAMASLVRADDYRNPDTIFGESTTKPGYSVSRARGHFSGKERLYSGDVINGLYGRGWDGSAFSTSDRISIEMQASETWSSTANGTKMLFKVTPAGTTVPVQVLSLDTGGVTFSSMTLIDAYKASFGPVTAGSTSTVTWTETVDRLAEFTTSSFTALTTGYYEVIVHGGVSQTAGSACFLLKLNNASFSGGIACNQGVTGLASVLDLSITKILSLTAGDIVRVDASATTADATFLNAMLTIKELP